MLISFPLAELWFHDKIGVRKSIGGVKRCIKTSLAARVHRIVLGFSIFFATLGSAQAAPFRTYAIGNSLTVNATLNAMDDMATQAGISSFSSDHIYLGQSLNTIWNNPTHTDNPYGTEQGATRWPNSAG